ncbi:MAG: hypothetical protein RIQ81_767 [Pseudomonadota bacterium]|jgi:chromosome segregation ATPase
MSTQQHRKVKSLVIALICSVTAAVGAFVEAPPLPLALASLFAAIIVAARIIKARRTAETRSSDDEGEAKPPSGQPEDPAASLGSSLILSKLQVELMRASALEAELAEMRKRHDQLIEERMEYLRKAESHAQAAHQARPTPPTVITQVQEAADPVHRQKLEDALLASETASKTLKEDLEKLNRRIESITGTISPGQHGLGDVTMNVRRASDALEQAGNQFKAATARLKEVESVGESRTEPEISRQSVDEIASRLASISRQIGDATDVMRLTSLNLKLVAGRNPPPAGSADGPMAASNGLENLMEGLGTTAAEAKQLLTDFAALASSLEQSALLAAKEISSARQTRQMTSELISAIGSQVNAAREQLRVAMDGLEGKEKAFIEREMQGQEAISEAAARFAAATGWADSTALGIRTLLQGAESTDERR